MNYSKISLAWHQRIVSKSKKLKLQLTYEVFFQIYIFWGVKLKFQVFRVSGLKKTNGRCLKFSPEWQLRSQEWTPHGNVFLQIFPQLQELWSHLTFFFEFLQLHCKSLDFLHGAQLESWHSSSHLCMLHERILSHFFPHDQFFCEHRMVRIGDLPQPHFLCTICAHGGWLKGWQRRKHRCPHSGSSGLLQISPQEWGRRNGWTVGSYCFPQ